MQHPNYNNNKNSPLIPPLSVSLPPSQPDPPPRPVISIPTPRSNPRPNSKPIPNPKSNSHSIPNPNFNSNSTPNPNPNPNPNPAPRPKPVPNPKSISNSTPNPKFFSTPTPNPNHVAKPEPKITQNSVIIPTSEPKPKPDQTSHFKTKPNPKFESPSSPLRSESPHRSDEPGETYEDATSKNNETALVAVEKEKYYSPLTSPLPLTPPKDDTNHGPLPPGQQIIHFSRREDIPAAQSGVVGTGERKGRGRGVRFATAGGGEEERGVVRRTGKEEVVKKVAIGIRVFEVVLCLISFSVMAADKTQGWSGDSFDRYKEYRFCLTVAILGFVYSGFQAYDLASHLVTGKHVIAHHLRYQFDFIIDQIIAYLLVSASSAAASRVDDWQANWGKDEFTEKASASISMAFLAFICFAMSSLISGYNLCNRDLY